MELTKTGLLASLQRWFRIPFFRLFAVYFIVFTSFSYGVLSYLSWMIENVMDEEITAQIEYEKKLLFEEYNQGGRERLIEAIERRGRQAGSSLFLLMDQKGDFITGNALLKDPPPPQEKDVGRDLPNLTHETSLPEFEFNWPNDPDNILRLAKIGLYPLKPHPKTIPPCSNAPACGNLAAAKHGDDGLQLFVGYDLDERERIEIVIYRARTLSLALAIFLGGLVGFWLSNQVLSRVEAIGRASARLLAGDMSERLPLSGNDDEFDSLAAPINTLLDRVDHLMRGLREVSDHVAHDLRTPLTRLRAAAETGLRHAQSGEATPHLQQALERVLEESERLIGIFDTVLLITRAQSGNLSPSFMPLDVAEMLQEMEELYQPLAEEKGFQLLLDAKEGLMILGNRAFLARALSNLIENTLKYGRPQQVNTDAIIRLRARKTGENVEICVADHGVGIAPEDHARVLARFGRLDASRQQAGAEIGGAGLGLSLVAAIVALHKGRLMLEDNAPGLLVKLILPNFNFNPSP